MCDSLGTTHLLY